MEREKLFSGSFLKNVYDYFYSHNKLIVSNLFFLKTHPRRNEDFLKKLNKILHAKVPIKPNNQLLITTLIKNHNLKPYKVPIFSFNDKTDFVSFVIGFVDTLKQSLENSLFKGEYSAIEMNRNMKQIFIVPVDIGSDVSFKFLYVLENYVFSRFFGQFPFYFSAENQQTKEKMLVKFLDWLDANLDKYKRTTYATITLDNLPNLDNLYSLVYPEEHWLKLSRSEHLAQKELDYKNIITEILSFFSDAEIKNTYFFFSFNILYLQPEGEIKNFDHLIKGKYEKSEILFAYPEINLYSIHKENFLKLLAPNAQNNINLSTTYQGKEYLPLYLLYRDFNFLKHEYAVLLFPPFSFLGGMLRIKEPISKYISDAYPNYLVAKPLKLISDLYPYNHSASVYLTKIPTPYFLLVKVF